MFDEEARKPASAVSLPRPLVGLSVEDLEGYVRMLEGEIVRVRKEIAERRDVRGAAEALFKKRAD